MCNLGLGQKCDKDSFQGWKGCQAEGMELSGEWCRAELGVSRERHRPVAWADSVEAPFGYLLAV